MSSLRSRLPTLVAALAAAALTSCGGHPSVFHPAGPAARSIARLGWWTIAALVFAAAATLGIIVAAATRRRGSLASHAPVDVGGGHRFIFVGGFLVPGVVLSAIFVASLVTTNEFPLHDGEHYRPDIRILGRQWWWEVHYVGDKTEILTTANEIHVPVGWPVEIELDSRDVIHSFWVPSLHGKVDLVPGRKNHIRILADQPGRYEGQCAEFCGVQHTNMKFEVVAEPMEVYEAWLAHQIQPAAVPADPEAKRGMDLFETRACGLCHTVRGTRALGTVGPDLTHLASRRGLASYAFPLNRAYLEAWITHAQSLKPGSQMPDVTDFTGDELQALGRYLEGLE